MEKKICIEQPLKQTGISALKTYYRWGNRKADIPGIDIYGEWQRNLSSLKLDGILTCFYEDSKVQEYIEKNIGIRPQGRPISNWDNTES